MSIKSPGLFLSLSIECIYLFVVDILACAAKSLTFSSVAPDWITNVIAVCLVEWTCSFLSIPAFFLVLSIIKFKVLRFNFLPFNPLVECPINKYSSLFVFKFLCVFSRYVKINSLTPSCNLTKSFFPPFLLTSITSKSAYFFISFNCMFIISDFLNAVVRAKDNIHLSLSPIKVSISILSNNLTHSSLVKNSVSLLTTVGFSSPNSAKGLYLIICISLTLSLYLSNHLYNALRDETFRLIVAEAYPLFFSSKIYCSA